MNTQDTIETLYDAQDVLEKKYPADEETTQEILEKLAEAQRVIDEVMEEIKKLKK